MITIKINNEYRRLKDTSKEWIVNMFRNIQAAGANPWYIITVEDQNVYSAFCSNNIPTSQELCPKYTHTLEEKELSVLWKTLCDGSSNVNEVLAFLDKIPSKYL